MNNNADLSSRLLEPKDRYPGCFPFSAARDISVLKNLGMTKCVPGYLDMHDFVLVHVRTVDARGWLLWGNPNKNDPEGKKYAKVYHAAFNYKGEGFSSRYHIDHIFPSVQVAAGDNHFRYVLLNAIPASANSGSSKAEQMLRDIHVLQKPLVYGFGSFKTLDSWAYAKVNGVKVTAVP